jgi:hypothetical protein
MARTYGKVKVLRNRKMDQEQLRKIIDSPEEYDDSKEDNLLSMVGQLYSRKMFSSFIAHAAYSSVFIALAVFCGIKFFDTDQIQFQIMYAAIFVCCIEFVILRKNIYWQMLHKNSISREIKRLELRIAELAEIVKGK